MKHTLTIKRLGHLHAQRNALLALCGGMLLTNIILGASLFLKKERVIITPPDLKRSYWVEGNKFSPSYLEAWCLHFAHLMLDVTASSINYQGATLLRYVIPEAHGSMTRQLLQEEKRLKKEQLSIHFHPIEISLNPDSLSAEITGDLISYIADKKVDQHRDTYVIKLQNRGGELMIEAFTLLKTDKPEDKNHE